MAIPVILSHGCFPRRLLLTALAAGVVVSLGGCAPGPAWQFADAPGVPVSVSVGEQGTATGTLVAYEDGAFIFERSYERGEDVEVLRRDGTDYVYVRGIVVGTLVEVRDFDVVTRQRISPGDVTTMGVKTRAYAGWGSVLAGVLTFFLVMVLGDV